MTYIHISPDEYILRPNEHFACRNASVIVDENDEFCGWVDNDSLIMMLLKEDGGDTNATS